MKTIVISLLAYVSFNLATYPPIDANGNHVTSTPIRCISEVGSPRVPGQRDRIQRKTPQAGYIKLS
jgi:hypothetical protein